MGVICYIGSTNKASKGLTLRKKEELLHATVVKEDNKIHFERREGEDFVESIICIKVWKTVKIVRADIYNKAQAVKVIVLDVENS